MLVAEGLDPFGLGDRWSFVNYDGTYHGRSAEDVSRYCVDADLYLNLSGGSWFWRDEYGRIPRKAFIDSDPGFTQLAIAKNEPWYVEFFRRFDRLYTFGSNIGTPSSTSVRIWRPSLADSPASSPAAGSSSSSNLGWAAHARATDRILR